MWDLGDITWVCQRSGIPLCNIFPRVSVRTCVPKGLQINSTAWATNLGDSIMAFIAIVVMIVVMVKTYRKYAAVGRKELNFLFAFYILTLMTQIVTEGGFIDNIGGNRQILQYVSAAHIGLIAATFFALIWNAFVGYQWLADGGKVSMTGLTTGALIILGGTMVISIDTSFGNIFNYFYHNDNTQQSVPLFVLDLIWPAACCLVFTIAQVVLVMKFLGERKPLFLLIAAVLLIGLGQAIMFFLNTQICTGTSQYVDGALFSTLATLLAMITVFKYWDCITADDWDDSWEENQF